MIPWAMNPYYRIYDAVVSIGAGAVASKDAGLNLNVGDIVLAASCNIDSAITGAGGCTAVSLGIAGTITKYGEGAALTKNAKIAAKLYNPTTVLSAAEDLLIYATDGAGSATGTIASGSLRVRVEYLRMSDLPDA